MRFEKKTPYFALFRHWPDHLQYMSMHSTLVEAFLLVALENNTMSSAYMTCVMAGALMPALTPSRFFMETWSFKIPSGVCDKFDALSHRFWGKPKSLNGTFLALTTWDNIYKPTCKDGLGFRKAKDFNDALLAKLAWMIASKRDSLCMSILRAKYKVCHS